MDKLGIRLREERKRLGLSQQQFGAIGGVEANAQGKYEHDERVPRCDYLVALEQNGVDVLYVLTGNRSPVGTDMLNDDERAIILHYRSLNEEDKDAISQLALSLSHCEE